jgi:hypothetical protein
VLTWTAIDLCPKETILYDNLGELQIEKAKKQSSGVLRKSPGPRSQLLQLAPPAK